MGGMFWQLISRRRWLSLLALLLLSLWGAAKIADPLPNSSLWRYFRTDHRVHVLIEAEVDGEAVKLERNFRCYWDHRPALSYDLPSGRRLRQAGAVIGATLKDGRYVSVSLPSLCMRPSSHHGNHYTQTGVPIFRVSDRLRDPSRIEVQVDPEAVLSGRHGVKLVSILVENPAPPSIPATPDWMDADYQGLSKEFDSLSFDADYAHVRPREWWHQFPDAAATLEKITEPGTVDQLPGIQEITLDLHIGYVDADGWLTKLDDWGKYKVVSPRLAEVHPLRVRKGVRILDMETTGVVEFAPMNGPNGKGWGVSTLPIRVAETDILLSRASYSVFEPSSGILLSLQGDDLHINMEGQ